MNLEEAVVFAILMQNNDGILGKHPSYVMEKLQAVQGYMPNGLLDAKNTAIYNEYLKKWSLALLNEYKGGK